MPSRQRQSPILQTLVSPVPTTIFCRLPQRQKPQLAHLLADLIRRVRTATQDQEGDHERGVVASHTDDRPAGQDGLCLHSPILAHAGDAPSRRVLTSNMSWWSERWRWD